MSIEGYSQRFSLIFKLLVVYLSGCLSVYPAFYLVVLYDYVNGIDVWHMTPKQNIIRLGFVGLFMLACALVAHQISSSAISRNLTFFKRFQWIMTRPIGRLALLTLPVYNVGYVVWYQNIGWRLDDQIAFWSYTGAPILTLLASYITYKVAAWVATG
jgi:hypothetical protein